MRLLWLADALRSAGLSVLEYPGWRVRGSSTFTPAGVICHATAGVLTPDSDRRVLWVTGSLSAPAPISQLFLDRAGVWSVGASGRCNHVLSGKAGSPFEGKGNTWLLGIEAANNNIGEPWRSVQLDSYIRGVAAILRHTGWPVAHVLAHREHQTGKSDPLGIDMTAFRGRVANLLKGDDMPTVDEIWAKEIRDSVPRADGTRPPIPASVALMAARTDAFYGRAEAAAVRAALEGMAGGDPDVAAILAGMDQRLATLRAGVEDDVRDAVADQAEGGAQRVREDA